MADRQLVISLSEGVQRLLAARAAHYLQPIDRYAQAENLEWVKKAEMLNMLVAEMLTATVNRGSLVQEGDLSSSLESWVLDVCKLKGVEV